MKRLLLTATLVLLAFGTASAFPLYTGTAEQPGTQFEDDNLEYWFDNNQSGLLDVGDVLVSAVEFTKVLDLVGGAPEYDLDQDTDELVAIATVKLLSIEQTMIGQTWFFGQDGETPMVQVYTGGSDNLDLFTAGSDPSYADAVAAITDGEHLWDFSITDDPDTFWTFQPLNLSANNPLVVAGLNATTKVGVVNYQLNQVWGDDIFANVLGDIVIDDGLVDLAGSGDILGGEGLTNGAFARSDVDVLVNPVPEPATLTLFGLGLLSVAASIRKRKK